MGRQLNLAGDHLFPTLFSNIIRTYLALSFLLTNAMVQGKPLIRIAISMLFVTGTLKMFTKSPD